MVGFLQENNRSVLEVYQIKRKHTLFCWFKSLMSYSLDLQSALTETTWIKLSIAYQNNNMNKTKLNPPDTQHQLPCTNWTCIQCWLTIQRWRNEQTHLLFYLLISRTFKKNLLNEKPAFDQSNKSLHSIYASNLIIRGECFAWGPHHLFPSHFPFW